MTRLGLVGAGPWGRRYISTVSGLKDVSLAAVASSNPETKSLVGPECKVVSDWKKLVKAKDLDGLIIATPPGLHAEMALAAIKAGKPVLVEKPLTLDLKEAQALLKAAEGKVFVLVDHIYLFHPAFEALKAKARELGPIRSVLTIGGNKGPVRKDVSALWDYGPHDVAMCLDLFQEKPLSVSVFRRDRPGIVNLKLEFSSGASASIEVGNGMAKRHRYFAVRFDKQVLFFDDTSPLKLRLKPVSEAEEAEFGEAIPVSDEPPLSRAVKAFTDGIRSGSKDTRGLRLAVDVVEVLARCDAGPR